MQRDNPACYFSATSKGFQFHAVYRSLECARFILSLGWIFESSMAIKITPTVVFWASTFLTFFVYSIISHCESTLTDWGGFKRKTFMGSSFDLGTKHHHILAKIWFTSFLKFEFLCMSSVLFLFCDSMWFCKLTALFFSPTKTGAGSLFRCKSSQINPRAFTHGLLLWCLSMCKSEEIPSVGHSFSNQQQPI